MAKGSMPGIWAMEGAWSARVTDVRSISPVLSAMDAARVAKTARHHLNHPEDLAKQLGRWAQRQHESYGIGYLALHGSPGAVYNGQVPGSGVVVRSPS